MIYDAEMCNLDTMTCDVDLKVQKYKSFQKEFECINLYQKELKKQKRRV